MNDLIVIQASQVRAMIFMFSELALTTVARDFVRELEAYNQSAADLVMSGTPIHASGVGDYSTIVRRFFL